MERASFCGFFFSAFMFFYIYLMKVVKQLCSFVTAVIHHTLDNGIAFCNLHCYICLLTMVCSTVLCAYISGGYSSSHHVHRFD